MVKVEDEATSTHGSVRLHKDLLARIDRLMEYGQDGFSTRNSVVSEAVRQFLRAKEEEWVKRQQFENLLQQRPPEAPPVPFQKPWPERLRKA